MDMEKVIKGLTELKKYLPSTMWEPINNAIAMLKEQKLVRCKDCKHSEPWYSDKSICFLWHETGIDVFNDGFCNYGERQEGR